MEVKSWSTFIDGPNADGEGGVLGMLREAWKRADLPPAVKANGNKPVTDVTFSTVVRDLSETATKLHDEDLSLGTTSPDVLAATLLTMLEADPGPAYRGTCVVTVRVCGTSHKLGSFQRKIVCEGGTSALLKPGEGADYAQLRTHNADLHTRIVAISDASTRQIVAFGNILSAVATLASALVQRGIATAPAGGGAAGLLGTIMSVLGAPPGAVSAVQTATAPALTLPLPPPVPLVKVSDVGTAPPTPTAGATLTRDQVLSYLSSAPPVEQREIAAAYLQKNNMGHLVAMLPPA